MVRRRKDSIAAAPTATHASTITTPAETTMKLRYRAPDTSSERSEAWSMMRTFVKLLTLYSRNVLEEMARAAGAFAYQTVSSPLLRKPITHRGRRKAPAPPRTDAI